MVLQTGTSRLAEKALATVEIQHRHCQTAERLPHRIPFSRSFRL
jgi:hypothetical protein